MVVLLYLAVLILIVAGISWLGKPRTISDEEYEAMRGKGTGPGNALSRGAGDILLGLDAFFDPSRRHIRKAREEIRVEREGGGDPPEPPQG